ncbi:g13233 [Coccomyxa viridis]|uniref:G13233 protein n=1 Tax=Coccomyxa viridis TaxID=1274662 RepID=A0ABP1GJE3_9CHLO
MESPASGDRGANGAGRCAPFGSVGMSMAMPKPAGTNTLGTSAASQAFKRQRTVPSVRSQDSKGADMMDEECLSHATKSDGVQGQDTAEHKRCPLCHQLTLRPLQEQQQEFEFTDRAHSGYGPHRLRQALSKTSVTPQQVVVNGGLLLAAFLGQKVLRWMLKRRRRRGPEGAAMEMREGDAGQDTGYCHYNSLGDEAAHAQGSCMAFSQAPRPQPARQAAGSSSGVSSEAEGGSMQRHLSALLPKRTASRQALARGASPEEVNRSLYQYATLAVQQSAGPLARRR